MVDVFFFKQKTAYEMLRSLVGSEMCIRDRYCVVSVDLDERDLERAHGWFRDRVSLRVEGRVATVPGKPSRIERLEAIGPISEGQFQFGGTAS